ncbi:hypothetical protein D3C71_1556570 [compost metagenome]
MALQRDAVDGRFYCRVEQLDDQPQQADRDHDRPLCAADRQPEGSRYQQHVEQHQLAESGFALEGGAQAVQRIAGGIENTFQASLALEWRHVRHFTDERPAD